MIKSPGVYKNLREYLLCTKTSAMKKVSFFYIINGIYFR